MTVDFQVVNGRVVVPIFDILTQVLSPFKGNDL